LNSGIGDRSSVADTLDVEDPFDRDLSVRTLTWLVGEMALPPGIAGPEIEATCRRLGAVMPADEAGTVVAAVLRAQRSLIDGLINRAEVAERVAEVGQSEIAALRTSLESSQDQIARLTRRNRALRRRLADFDNARSIRAARVVTGRVRGARARLIAIGSRSSDAGRAGTG